MLVAMQGTSHELELVSAQWEAVRSAGDRWSRGWCLAASAALGRVTLALSAFADEICGLVQVRDGRLLLLLLLLLLVLVLLLC